MFIFVTDKREGCQTFMILMQSVEMMRFIIVSVLFVLSASVRLAGQTLEISGFPAGHLQENSYNGKPFYAIKDENRSLWGREFLRPTEIPAGSIRFRSIISRSL